MFLLLLKYFMQNIFNFVHLKYLLNKINFFNFRDCSRCLKYLAFRGSHNQFLFLGDSRILDIYNAFIHTIEPKAQLIQSSKFSQSHSFNTDHSFHDSRLKLDVHFVWSPYVLDPMVKKLKASKLNFPKIIFLFLFDLNKNKIYSDI